MEKFKQILTIVLQVIALAAIVLSGIWIISKFFLPSGNNLWQFIQMVVINPKKDADVKEAGDLKTALDAILHPEIKR